MGQHNGDELGLTFNPELAPWDALFAKGLQYEALPLEEQAKYAHHLAEIKAVLIKAMISRSREFVADADGAKIAGSPHGLASALQRLESVARRVPLHNPNPAMNNLFIVEPFVGQALTRLFASHPPTEQRIAALLGNART